MKNRRLIIIILIVTFLLLIPLIAMQFSDAVNWDLGDFIIGGCLLMGTGLLVEFIIRNVRRTAVRLAIIVILFVMLLLTWAELAVGVFGTPFAGS